MGIVLPEDYRSFLQLSDGFNDELGDGYLILWSVDELSGADGYDILGSEGEGTLIGSNGGSTAYGIVDGRYVSVPFVFAGPAADEMRVLGDSFEDFLVAVESGQGW